MAEKRETLAKRWRRFEVSLQRNERLQQTLRSLISGYVTFAYRTIRWEFVGLESLEADIARDVSRVLCCWHEQLMFTPYLRNWADHPLFIIASPHADAQLATANMEKMPGVSLLLVRTSGDNSGPIREAVRRLRRGASMGIAVDGPLGPAKRAKPGAIVIAGLAGVQVSPVAYAVSRKVRLPTWDGFIMPIPYARGVMAVGDGFVPPKRQSPEDTEAAAERLGGLLDALTVDCEARLAARRTRWWQRRRGTG